jgi:hypothetical protein
VTCIIQVITTTATTRSIMETVQGITADFLT